MRSFCFVIGLLGAACITASANPRSVGTAVLSNTPLIDVVDLVPMKGAAPLQRLSVNLAESVRVIDEDGESTVIARISTGGAPAARLLIQDMALPSGAKLFLFGRSADGRQGQVYGPYTGTGPLESGEFWTDSVAGSEIVLELQMSTSLKGVMPFRVEGLIAEESGTAPDLQTDESATSEIQTSLFRGIPLTHHVKNGMAIFEGDIKLGQADELPAATETKNGRRDAVAITGAQYRWPGGIIPYLIDAAVPSQTRITAAIDHWNTTMAGHVKLVPRTYESAYAKFVRAASAGTCSSNVGRLGSAQTIDVGDYCSTGNMIHEIGHAAGLWHEQSREDRNSFVKILWANVQTGREHNFEQQITWGDDISTYNFGSVMHYPASAFSSNGQPTIETIPAGIPIGQRSGLNAGDLTALKLMYPSTATTPGATTVAVTVSTNPAGLPIAVDGIATVAPASFNWAPGSVHTISALSSTPVNGTKYVFNRWSDGGAATHQVTVPTSATTYRADYVVNYLLNAAASPVGTVTRNPYTADSYYTPGTSVQISSMAPAGYCFSSWTGLLPGAPNPASVSMSAPQSVIANLQLGSITISPLSVTTPRTTATISLNVAATSGCFWSATSDSTWAKIVSGVSGTGAGVVKVQVEAKKGGNKRTARITVGGATVSILQQ